MSEVGVHMCNGVGDMAPRTICECCPYGYHIDLDFVRFCEAVARNSGEPSPGKRQRRERRRQRQSMEVLLGLTNPVIWKIEQLLPPIHQEPSASDDVRATTTTTTTTTRADAAMSSSSSSRASHENDALDKAVMDFEATLERASKRKAKYRASDDADSLERCRPKSKSEESSPRNASYADFELMTMCSNGNSLTTSPLQNIREQMAISLERMRELEERVKTIPSLELELHSLRNENSYLESRLEELRRALRAADANIRNLRERESEANRKPSMMHAGVMCCAVTRDVGTAPLVKKLRSSGTETDATTAAAAATTATCSVQVRPQAESKSTETEMKREGWFPKDPERMDRGAQTSFEEAANALQVAERREAAVQAREDRDARDVGVAAKPKAADASVDARPRVRDVGASYDKTTDVLCDRCKNVKTRHVGVGSGDVRSAEKWSESPGLPERSKSFHGAAESPPKLTRNIAVGTVAPIRKLTSTKNVDTQDFSASRSKNIGMNTNETKLVDASVGSDSSLDDLACPKCSSSRSKERDSRPKDAATHKKDLQPSKIPRPKSLNTTPVMERKRFLRQDTYTKSLVSPTSESPKKTKPRVNSSSDKIEPNADEKVEVTRRSKAKPGEQPVAEAEQIHKDLKDLQLDEGSEGYNRQYDDYCYDYDENYGDQDSKRNSQLFPENVLFQPIQDEPREKIAPSKEMKAAMKVVNDSLNKYPGGLPRHLKNASNILQQEWFKISSTASANPLDVEDYLDSFEEVSNTLLEYVVNMVDNNGNTAMHYAVSHGNFDVVSILLDSKVCNINKPNAAGYTCIMLVSLAQVRSETHRQVIRRLFQLADVNIRAKQHGQTTLMLAVSHGRLDMVKLLLEAGADPNIQDGDGSTALMCAAEHGHTDIVKHILAHPDCDPSIVDCDGSTALAIAMEAGNRDIGVLLYAREHFASGSRGSSPYTSVRQRRCKTSGSPHSRTPTSPNPNRRSDHSM